MQVIPVIDVKIAQVVYAFGGRRDLYQTIESPLSQSSAPCAVVDGLLSIHPFSTLYVADLDGITTGAPDLDLVHQLASAFPQLDIWIDNGAASIDAVAALVATPRVFAVIGSETLPDVESLAQIVQRFGERTLLSLDFKGDAFLGPSRILQETRHWPARLIAMTLAAVGSRAGPDIARIAELKARAPYQSIVAAGGVRDKHDLVALARAGADAAIVATALHTGTLKAGDLVEIAGLQCVKSDAHDVERW